MKARIVITLTAKTPEKVAEMKEIKRQVDCGEFQRDIKETGMGVTASFEYLERE